MSLPDYTLNGRVALVTGAGTGLGKQFAETLAAAGATVVLAARRRQKLEETAELIKSNGGNAWCVDMDVSDSDAVKAGYAEIAAQSGAVDILVNNAGIGAQTLLTDTTEEDWDAVVDTNLKGVFLVAKAAAQQMIEAGNGGSIINIASILGLRVAKGLSPYIAAKAGVINLTQAMALELARFKIRVNSISPGYFKTDINRDVLDSPQGAAMLKAVPMRRHGETPELAGALLLLASDAGSFMTGSNIVVDGGQVCSSL